ncbi:hypothetical protein BH11ARM1_BH11ARM1_02490 [soil metagenome]
MMQCCSLAVLFLAFASLQGTPEASLARLTKDVDQQLAKEQLPPLYAWHLRSLKALAMSEYAKFELGVPINRTPLEDRKKEFVQFVDIYSTALETDGVNPDLYLKEGRRSLILVRPSNIDGSLQYAMVSLPQGWDSAKEYPLVVSLHGTGPANPLAYPSYALGPIGPASTGPMSQMIHLTPWGRGNSSWRNDNERDLWEAISQLKTFAKLDRDHWYIAGHSSGADGTWAIVQHTPDLWAAFGLESGSMLEGPPERGLIKNMIYVPGHFLIGENDTLPNRIPDTKAASEIWQKAGTPTKLLILKGIGHYPLAPEGYKSEEDFLVQFSRKRPNKFEFTIDDPRHPGVWGIDVVLSPLQRRFIAQPWPHFTCEVKGQEVRITTDHIDKITVITGSNGLGMTGNVTVVVNGKTIYEGPASEDKKSS